MSQARVRYRDDGCGRSTLYVTYGHKATIAKESWRAFLRRRLKGPEDDPTVQHEPVVTPAP